MAKQGGLRNWPPKRFRYDVQAEKDWTPPPPKKLEPVVFVKPVDTDIHLTDEGWMG